MDKLPLPEERAGETPAPQAWREELIRELTRRRVPRAWQARLLEELDDHLSDLREERMSTTTEPFSSPEERLGRPHEIAAATVAEYRKLGLFARQPVLTYFGLPIVATPLALAAFLIVTMFPMAWALEGAEYLLGSEREPLANSVMNGIVAAAVYTLRFVPFALLAWMFCRLARRHGRGWRCVLSACTVMAIYAAIFSITFHFRTPSQQGALMMGFAFPPQQLLNYVQASVPLAVGLFFLWRMSPRRFSASPIGSTSMDAAQVAAG